MGSGISLPKKMMKSAPPPPPPRKRNSLVDTQLSAADLATVAARHGGGKLASPPKAGAAVDATTPAGAAKSSGILDLDAVLLDKEASGVFMAFARADMSEENLEFYLSVADFRSAGG